MITTGARSPIVRQYLTRSEVARLFEVSPATVARWTREGRLAFVLTLGGQRRYLRQQIVDLIRGRTVPSRLGVRRGAGAGASPSRRAPGDVIRPPERSDP